MILPFCLTQKQKILLVSSGPVAEPRKLVTVCAWCPDAARVTELFERSGQQVTHGVCTTHYRELCKELDRAAENEAMEDLW